MDFGNRKVKIALAILLAIAAVVSFRIYNNIQKDKARAARMGQKRAENVVTALPGRQTIVPRLKFSGSLDPEWQAEIGSKVDGRLEKVFVKEGDRVTKGQVLAMLEAIDTDANLTSARGSFMDAETNLKKAEMDYMRYAKLGESGAVSQAVVDNYRFARDNAKAKLESARGNLLSQQSKAVDTRIIAPNDGIVYKRYYQEGYYAKAATPIFAIADISSLKTTIHIPEGNISEVAVGNKAKVELAAYPGKNVEGTITRIAPVADTPSHTFAAEVSIPNGDNMRAGIFATVMLEASAKENVMVVPLQAIVMRDDQKTVFVPDKDGFVKRKVIDVGYMDDKIAEVKAGLEENELIVVEGHNKLREGSQIKMDKKAGNTK